jgi:hypothetical protein
VEIRQPARDRGEHGLEVRKSQGELGLERLHRGRVVDHEEQVAVNPRDAEQAHTPGRKKNRARDDASDE